MRLYDDIRASAVNERALGPKLSGLFNQAPVIVADNVTEYYYAISDREVWNYEDFPNVAPPFPSFFIETRRPSIIFTEGEYIGLERVPRPDSDYREDAVSRGRTGPTAPVGRVVHEPERPGDYQNQRWHGRAGPQRRGEVGAWRNALCRRRHRVRARTVVGVDIPGQCGG